MLSSNDRIDKLVKELMIENYPNVDIVKAMCCYAENNGISSSAIDELSQLQEMRNLVNQNLNLQNFDPDKVTKYYEKYLKVIRDVVNIVKKPFLISYENGSFNEYYLNLSYYGNLCFRIGILNFENVEIKKGIPYFRKCIWALEEIKGQIIARDKGICEMAYALCYLALFFLKENDSKFKVEHSVKLLNESAKYLNYASINEKFKDYCVPMSDLCIAVGCALMSIDLETHATQNTNNGHFGQAICFAKKCITMTSLINSPTLISSLEGKAINYATIMNQKVNDLVVRNNRIYKDFIPSENSFHLPSLNEKLIFALDPYK